MITVYGYRMPGWKTADDLIGLTGNSLESIINQLEEGDNVTVKVEGRGYKAISKKNGKTLIQKNYSYDY